MKLILHRTTRVLTLRQHKQHMLRIWGGTVEGEATPVTALVAFLGELKELTRRAGTPVLVAEQTADTIMQITVQPTTMLDQHTRPGLVCRCWQGNSADGRLIGALIYGVRFPDEHDARLGEALQPFVPPAPAALERWAAETLRRYTPAPQEAA